MATLDEFIGTDIVHQSDWKVTGTGDLDKITGLANLKNRLLHRLVTSPGGFVHLPLYGVGVKDFQNAPNIIGNQIALTKRIEQQFLQDDAVDSIEGVTFIKEDDRPDRVHIIVRVIVRGIGNTSFKFTPFGGVVGGNE